MICFFFLTLCIYRIHPCRSKLHFIFCWWTFQLFNLMFLLLLFWICLVLIFKDFWRRKWQPTPVLLPGKFHVLRSLVQSMGSQRVGHDWATSLHFTSRVLQSRFAVSWGIWMFNFMKQYPIVLQVVVTIYASAVYHSPLSTSALAL